MIQGSKGMKCAEFVNIMRERGFHYNEEKGGFITPMGKRAGKATRNGYRTIALQKDKEIYTFCEHRCVWVWFNGEIEDGLVINHKDFDRANNKIENLELLTQAENIKYTDDAGRRVIIGGEDSGKAIYTNKEAQAMRYLRKNGWKVKEIAEFFDSKYENTIGRIITGARYGKVPDAADVLSIYPAIVLHTINKDLSDEQQIGNAIAGMCGELGEVVDILKKALYQWHEIDEDHLIEELGDLLYYVTLLMCIIDYNMADTMFNNMDKLINRYPSGFSAERSIHRKE